MKTLTFDTMNTMPYTELKNLSIKELKTISYEELNNILYLTGLSCGVKNQLTELDIDILRNPTTYKGLRVINSRKTYYNYCLELLTGMFSWNIPFSKHV